MNKELKIYNGYHDYTYIDDLILFLDLLIKKKLITEFGEITNFGSGKQYSNFAILKFCEKIFKKKSNAKIIKKFQKIYDKKIWCSNNKYLIKRFNYKHKFSIQKGIEYYSKIYNLCLRIGQLKIGIVFAYRNVWEKMADCVKSMRFFEKKTCFIQLS